MDVWKQLNIQPRYSTPWAFYDNEKQPVGDNNSLLFLGVSQFGCPESFTIGDPPETGYDLLD